MAEVLVVDDDAEACKALVRLFERAGHGAHCVYGGGEALEVLQNVRFKLVLLDLRMPGIGGMEVLRAMRSDATHRATPVVIVSAEGSGPAVEAALKAGADDYVHKPVRWGNLYHRVQPFLQ
jgi:DNA-binding response OmpR family regulator